MARPNPFGGFNVYDPNTRDAAPKIVVGNTGAGDVISQVDFLDSGNGAQLAAALAAADGDNDVYIRPGTYDLSAAGAPAAPLAIPTGVRVRGAGREHVTIVSPAAGEQVTINMPNARAVLSDLTVRLASGDGTGVGTEGVITVDGANCVLEHVQVEVDPAIVVGDVSLRSAFFIDGDNYRLIQCDAGSQAENIPSWDAVPSAFHGFTLDVSVDVDGFSDGCRVYGADNGFNITTSGHTLWGCSSDAADDVGFLILGTLVGLHHCRATTTGIPVSLTAGADTNIVAHCHLDPPGTGTGILLTTSDENTIHGNFIAGALTGIDLVDSDGNNISENQIELAAAGTGIDLDATSDDNRIGDNEIHSGTNGISITAGAADNRVYTNSYRALTGTNLTDGGTDTLIIDERIRMIDATVLIEGTTGAIPAAGGGTRLMWGPAKGAFRAGSVTGTAWDDANVGDESVAFGSNTTASGLQATALGTSTRASSSRTVASGQLSVANHLGEHAQSYGVFSVAGDAQTSTYVQFRQTTDAVLTELSANGTAPSGAVVTSATRFILEDDTTYLIQIAVVARRSDADNESAGYLFELVADQNGGVSALVGAVLKTVLAEDTAAWDADVNVDAANDSVRVQVTGEAGKTINWVAFWRIVKSRG